jgi:hypothetical protein
MTKTGLIVGFIVVEITGMVIGYALHRQFDPFKEHVKGVVVYNGSNRNIGLSLYDSTYDPPKWTGKVASVFPGEVRRIK